MKRSQMAGVDPPPPTMTSAPAPGSTGRAAAESASPDSLDVAAGFERVAQAESVRSEAAANVADGRKRWNTRRLLGRGPVNSQGICAAASRSHEGFAPAGEDRSVHPEDVA